jgi:hypothetical protein
MSKCVVKPSVLLCVSSFSVLVYIATILATALIVVIIVLISLQYLLLHYCCIHPAYIAITPAATVNTICVYARSGCLRVER